MISVDRKLNGIEERRLERQEKEINRKYEITYIPSTSADISKCKHNCYFSSWHSIKEVQAFCFDTIALNAGRIGTKYITFWMSSSYFGNNLCHENFEKNFTVMYKVLIFNSLFLLFI
ncbi:hypothetical protein ILUMI_17852 [Ignelater luminosus]|uniref:Uncharacterized protein n=1 Tax=Ignelater luminosus TaxID=2038154 RepID=A0A8K0CMI7_IGNLU|nr:hypothetical protein ILUMI_17852 [Ignelater luminosus]